MFFGERGCRAVTQFRSFHFKLVAFVMEKEKYFILLDDKIFLSSDILGAGAEVFQLSDSPEINDYVWSHNDLPFLGDRVACNNYK